MFNLEEKKYLLRLLKKERRKIFFKRPSTVHQRLVEKLEQMVRNEEVNAKELD